ncbi:uncharacterized protein LOC123703820 [Colias croceus]|uniref:uncharacterized protein LOC123703820 n=1 Tax=Colias crocea TaxID=72248 RepID=UPI001E27DBC2|nr:uncharacterized protein LOC123703820 [Colias croceus]
MIFIFVVFFLSKSSIRETAASPAGPRADKNADLLEVIKLNLRTNNDDYADASTTSNVPSSSILYNYMRRKNKIESIIINNNNVLDFDKPDSVNNTKNNNQMFKPITIDNEKLEQVVKTNTKNPPSLTTHSYAMRVKFSKSKANKIERIKKFYEKNKDLLKEFLSSKIAAKTQTTKVTQKPDLRQKAMGKSVHSVHRQKAAKNIEIRKKVIGTNGVLSRGQDLFGNEHASEPHNADQLDMMPAIGGRIHFKRIEGRLCHRHVIVPEGPKYDSKGRVYLAAHAAKVRRPYDVTRRPRLLLPKCCNCCRKSVLGCE